MDVAPSRVSQDHTLLEPARVGRHRHTYIHFSPSKKHRSWHFAPFPAIGLSLELLCALLTFPCARCIAAISGASSMSCPTSLDCDERTTQKHTATSTTTPTYPKVPEHQRNHSRQHYQKGHLKMLFSLFQGLSLTHISLSLCVC